MIDIKNITADKLTNPGFIKDFFEEAEELVLFPNKQTKELAEKIYDVLYLNRESISKTEKKYQLLVSRLRFSGLWFYNENEIVVFFNKNIYDVLGLEEIDVRSKLKVKLIDLPIMDRDEFKQKIRNAIASNEQKIGDSAIVTKDGNVRSTIKAWFTDYLRYINTIVSSGGSEKIRQQQYFAVSKIFRSLSDSDQKKIRELFRLYEWLKLSSLTPEGVEESITIRDEDGIFYSMTEGRIEKLFKTKGVLKSRLPRLPSKDSYISAMADPLENLKTKYFTYRKDRDEVLKIEDALLVKTKGDVSQLKKELAVAVRQGDTNLVIAGIIQLARQKSLIDSLRNNPAWIEALENHLIKKFASEANPEDIKKAVNEIKVNPDSSVVVSEFLRYLLEDKSGLDDTTSALIGVEVGQLLGGDFEKMAYGNQVTGEFEWAKSEIVNGKLVNKE